MEGYDTAEKIPTAVLVGVHTGRMDYLNDCTQESIQELELLAKTAGATVEGIFVQNKESPENSTYIGEGKGIEIAEFCENNEIDIAIFDDELTPTQIRNLTNAIPNVLILDRSGLIMDIFAQRAMTSEGKLQVELAQLKYIMPRLTGSFQSLSKLGGGIGTRGPGETKLETDKRHIRRRIDIIREELKEVQKNRDVQRRKRTKEGVQQVSLIGYTNAGKSTLLNYLTDAGVLVEDKLFATLDPTARRLTLPDGANIVLIDTVGFIRKLPHHLIDAFKSTLEEAFLADVLVHVADGSDSNFADNVTIVENLLMDLKVENKPIITAINKCDRENISDISKENSVKISAKYGYGVDKLLELICKNLPDKREKMTFLIPFERGDLLPLLHKEGLIESEEYVDNGTKIVATIDEKTYLQLSEFVEK